MPDRKSDTLAEWLRANPGVEIVVRDGSTTYAETIRRSLPDARQVSDRWHLWHGLVRFVEKAVVAHSGCWAKLGPTRQNPTREKTTLERWHAVHALLDRGVGLLDCSQRLGLSLNTVKRYARVSDRSDFVVHRNTARVCSMIIVAIYALVAQLNPVSP